MFVLSKKHMEAFAGSQHDRFVGHMERHLRSRFPEECEKLGERGVRKRIDEGIEGASTYGIRAERDVATFIRYMFALGPGFDLAPQTAWAGEILRDKSRSPAQRLEAIRERARTERSAQRRMAASKG
jgi:hypothetical protein